MFCNYYKNPLRDFSFVNRCNFENCSKVVFESGLCSSCIYKIKRFEERLDQWLSLFYPDLALADIIGWYCKCTKSKCVRECLDSSYYIPGCECCPCNIELGYIDKVINNQMYPDQKWIKKLKKKIFDE